MIKSDLIIFKKDNQTRFLNYKTGKISNIGSTKFSFELKKEIFFLESDNKTLKSQDED